MQIDFYQIGQAGLESTLVTLLNKTCNAGKKALILCPAPAAVAIDDALWSYDAESWLPHGVDDADGTGHAPIWISTDMAANPIDAAFLFLLHGSEPAKWDRFERCFCLFDGRSDAQLSQARLQWAAWRDLPDVKLDYYAQTDSGGWEKKA